MIRDLSEVHLLPNNFSRNFIENIVNSISAPEYCNFVHLNVSSAIHVAHHSLFRFRVFAAHSRCSVNICRWNEWVNEWTNKWFSPPFSLIQSKLDEFFGKASIVGPEHSLPITLFVSWHACYYAQGLHIYTSWFSASSKVCHSISLCGNQVYLLSKWTSNIPRMWGWGAERILSSNS